MTADPREIAQRIFAGIRRCLPADSHTQKGIDEHIDSITAILAAEMPRWVPVEEPPKKDGMYFCIVNPFGKDDDKAIREFIAADDGFDFDDTLYWLDGVPSPPKERA